MSCGHVVTRAPDGSCVLCDRPRLADRIRDASFRRALARKALRELCLRSLYDFFVHAWPHTGETETLEPAPHHRVLCDHLQASFEEWLRSRRQRDQVPRMRDLAINAPPGTAKSRIVMVIFPAWALLRHAGWTCTALSGNKGVVERDSSMQRDLVESAWYRTTFAPDGEAEIPWRVRRDTDAKGKWTTTANGGRSSLPFLSKATGSRSHAILVDDPDDAHDVQNELTRKTRRSKWRAWSNRVCDKHSLRVLVQQRVHVEDTTADLLSQGGWTHVVIEEQRQPRDEHRCKCATCEAGQTPIGWSDPRPVGEWLQASRHGPLEAKTARAELTEAGYAAQHYQRPRTADGGWVARSHWRWYHVPGYHAGHAPRPDGCSTAPSVPLPQLVGVTAVVDATFGSTHDKASAVGLVVFGHAGPDAYVLSDRTRVMTFPEMLTAVEEVKREYPRARVLVEKKAFGVALMQSLRTRISGLIGVEPNGSKEARMHTCLPEFESGHVYLLDGAPWVAAHVEEVSGFPGAGRDDRVDCHSYFQIWRRGPGRKAELAAAAGAWV